ncbi:polyprenyl synthetase family protein [Calderihabitans maritimus]|uniref:Trans-hexaprenyltranstransferase n=1 Tax=Calderihabitans maritimus TaxID=1246530 RepID=A0A1Z5HVK0_9FIRM|nr:polyprenyl synthetase family protein [Calderihabitans maritimus]GAW93573.1 trans-hexaprenyltranstransferase [Calderihabitans maritimus]
MQLNLFSEIRQDLKQVEAELFRYVDASNPLLAETSAHLLRAGGKRLRPAFALLAGKFYNYSLSRLMPLAVALELIHMATLVHDDVIDAAATRRGIPTVRAKWGDRVSLHTGDYLFAQSLLLIARYEDPRIAQVLAEVSVQMCQGELQQIATAYDVNQSTRDYFYRIKRKTALLIAASCQLGAVATGAPAHVVRSLDFYGYYLGMAFQITDDILDITADQKELGKPIGGDLRQGVITLPVIYALKHSPCNGRLKELVKKREKTEDEVQEAIEIVKASGGIEYAFRVSNRYLAKAKEQLRKLPEIKTRDTLECIADFIAMRRF